MSTETKVGTFVLASVAILTVTLLYLANMESGGGIHYRTYLRYAGGLEPGAPVLFGGINAGRVTQVRPWASDATFVEILVDLKEGTPVNSKSVAKLGFAADHSEAHKAWWPADLVDRADDESG